MADPETNSLQDDLMLRANDIRKRYNRARETLFNRMQQYYRQSISSSYYKEEDMIEELEACAKLKAEYLEIRDILAGFGVKPAQMGGWTRANNNALFVKF